MTFARSLDTSWFCSSVGLTQGAVAGLKGVSPRLGAKALTQLPVLLTLLCKKQWLRIFSCVDVSSFFVVQGGFHWCTLSFCAKTS